MARGYKDTCPGCSGKNLWITPDNGMSYCYNCGYCNFDSNTPQVKQERYHDVTAIRQLYTELTAYYHSNVDHVRKYLHNRGLTDEEINTYKIGYCPSGSHKIYQSEHAEAAGIVKHNGMAFLGDRVTFPYWNSIYVTDIRGRAVGDDERRYLSPFGGSFHRGADYPFAWSNDSEVITEGEFKAIALRRAGFQAIGVPGITNIRPKSMYSIICFDSDTKKEHVQRAILRIAKYRKDIRIATIPLRKGEEKMGADDYIEKYGIEAMKLVLNAALSLKEWKEIML